ncbi:hypothetical protein BN1723_019544, partial [Verticillium longisporum]
VWPAAGRRRERCAVR